MSEARQPAAAAAVVGSALRHSSGAPTANTKITPDSPRVRERGAGHSSRRQQLLYRSNPPPEPPPSPPAGGDPRPPKGGSWSGVRARKSGLVRCDFDSGLFLCLDADATCTWRFLDELPAALGVEADRMELIVDTTEALTSLMTVAEELRESGMLGHAQQAIDQLDDVRSKRAEILQKYIVPPEDVPRRAQLAPPRASGTARRRAWDPAHVATQMHGTHCCVIDGFLAPSDATALRAMLGEMKVSGELKPGEVSGGLKPQTRGDLMAWVSTSDVPKPPLHALLAAVDDLVGALSTQPILAADLGNGKLLVRHEMQCTCYPGNGARYVRHVDDAAFNKSRRLTCIVYANPEWKPSHGGELRVHVKSGARDVEPLDGRLVLFWSDSRCPHEVLPAHKERYAVSIWFSDAAAVAEAAKAEAMAGRAVSGGGELGV